MPCSCCSPSFNFLKFLLLVFAEWSSAGSTHQPWPISSKGFSYVYASIRNVDSSCLRTRFQAWHGSRLHMKRDHCQ
ncbi:hypothetical protein CPB84DRAFT_1774086 [Gymnopilus junonius]|uniref:Secreted protein n=1 Tax=Gymnopilus junonius TaxID=109634 RepID=A0A9P5NR98_GYMJU|nr:hypothetical protein CPB84DRAFT_1774086 [Gymnopilus junonius]